MEFGAHLSLIDFAGEGLSYRRICEIVDAAKDLGFAAVSANDHFLFPVPWLDGPTALAAVVERSGTMQLMTSLALANLRGAVPLVKALTALDILSDGRVVAGVGPGSSRSDYEAVGVPFVDRWRRFDDVPRQLRSLLQRDDRAGVERSQPLSPSPVHSGGIPIWIGSWGSPAGLRRVARLGDGWLASAFNTTPEAFAERLELLSNEPKRNATSARRFPHALVSMWFWITDNVTDADRVLSQVLGPLLGRDPTELDKHVCIGPAEKCAELLSHYARAGCERVHFWPIGDERRQLERLANEVIPYVHR